MSLDSLDKECSCEANEFLKRYREKLDNFFSNQENLIESDISNISLEDEQEKKISTIEEITEPLDARHLSRLSVVRKKSSADKKVSRTSSAKYRKESLTKAETKPEKPAAEKDVSAKRKEPTEAVPTKEKQTRQKSDLELDTKRLKAKEDKLKDKISKLSKLISQQSIKSRYSDLEEIPVRERDTLTKTSSTELPAEEPRKYISKEVLAKPSEEASETSSISKMNIIDEEIDESIERLISSDRTLPGEQMYTYQQLLDERLQYLYNNYGDVGEGIERKPKISKMLRILYKPSLFSLSSSSAEFEMPERMAPEEPWMSESQRKAELYLKSHRIFDFFHFLGSHLVAESPKNSIDFLIELLDTCLHYRVGLCYPPLLFKIKHIESLVDSMDPMKTGYIDLEQYHTGMYTLRIRDYDKDPPTTNNLITRPTFVNEACKRLEEDFKDMIKRAKPMSRTYTPSYHSKMTWSAQ